MSACSRLSIVQRRKDQSPVRWRTLQQRMILSVSSPTGLSLCH